MAENKSENESEKTINDFSDLGKIAGSFFNSILSSIDVDSSTNTNGENNTGDNTGDNTDYFNIFDNLMHSGEMSINDYFKIGFLISKMDNETKKKFLNLIENKDKEGQTEFWKELIENENLSNEESERIIKFLSDNYLILAYFNKLIPESKCTDFKSDFKTEFTPGFTYSTPNSTPNPNSTEEKIDDLKKQLTSMEEYIGLELDLLHREIRIIKNLLTKSK